MSLLKCPIGDLNVQITACLQSIIQDLKKNFEIVKLITGSLVCCHRLAVTAGGNNGLSGSTLVDGRYTYQEVSLSSDWPDNKTRVLVSLMMNWWRRSDHNHAHKKQNNWTNPHMVFSLWCRWENFFLFPFHYSLKSGSQDLKLPGKVFFYQLYWMYCSSS